MTARSLMNFLPGNCFHVYITNLMAKPASSSKFMIISSVSTSPTGIVLTCDNEQSRMESNLQKSIYSDKPEDESVINTICFCPQEHSHKQVDQHNTVRDRTKIRSTTGNQTSRYRTRVLHNLKNLSKFSCRSSACGLATLV